MSGPSDTTAPTVTITSTETSPTFAATIPLTITFSESVTGFEVGDISVVGCTLGALGGSGAVYTVTATPTANSITVDIAANVAQDAAGNNNTAATQFAITSLKVGLQLWLKADAGIFTDDAATTPATADGNVIAVWQDQSGNNYHVAQTDNTKRPLLKLTTNGINSRPTILFDGANDILTNATANWLAANTAGSIFVVYRLTAALADTQILLASFDEATVATNGIAFYGCRTPATPRDGIYNRGVATGNAEDSVKGDQATNAATTYLIAIRSSGTAYSLRLNAVDEIVTIVAGSNSGDWWNDITVRDNFTVGGAKWSGGEAQWLKGSIAEMLVYNSNITGALLTSIETYLNARYAAF